MLRLPSENGTPAAIGPLSLIRNGTPASGPSAARESAGENSRSARPFTAAFASSTLRQALAVGADVLRVDWPDADYIADLAADEQTPTLALADAVHGDQPALVRCGDRSADRSTGALPAFLARELGAAQALGLVSLPVDGSQLIAERRLPAGRREPLRIPPPPSARWRPRAPPRGGAAIAASAGAGSGPRSAAVAGAGRGGAPVLTGQPRCSARTGGLGA